MASDYGDDAASSVSIPTSVVEAYEKPDHKTFQIIREEYYKLIEAVQQTSDQVGDGVVSADELKEIVIKANLVFEKVKRPQEARLDAKVLKHVGILGKATIEKTQSSLLSFNPTEFADHLVSFINSGEEASEVFEADSISLRGLAKPMTLLYRSTYGLEPLYGALDWKPPEKTVACRRVTEVKRLPVKNAIQKVVDSTTNEENQVEEINRIHEVLKRRYQENDCQPIYFMQFVINHKSFATTVENLFHASFLVRDGHVEITLDEDKVACIAPLRKKDKECRRLPGNQQQSRQMVIDMNMKLWQEAIEVYDIRESMIPPVVKKHKRPV